MKYMGSKRKMLTNGLGEILKEHAAQSSRVVDLFCGSAAVSWFLAMNTNTPVFSVDLQHFSNIIASAVTERTEFIQEPLENSWLKDAENHCQKSIFWSRSQRYNDLRDLTPTDVYEARNLCLMPSYQGPIWNSYGGYYFSPRQAIALDYLIKTIPKNYYNECLAAIIIAASKCVAAPGHTAQPFQPTQTALPYLLEAWQKNIFKHVEETLKLICGMKATAKGKGRTGDAIHIAKREIKENDLVFIDPPYSGVHYSRFYHVLETIARNNRIKVSGQGRYPALIERPQSDFSNKGTAMKALCKLFANLKNKKARVIFTFPEGTCSNGLSGDQVIFEAKKYFKENVIKKENSFSTMGGNNKIRMARQKTTELIILLDPK